MGEAQASAQNPAQNVSHHYSEASHSIPLPVVFRHLIMYVIFAVAFFMLHVEGY